jgi:hypothetical protein
VIARQMEPACISSNEESVMKVVAATLKEEVVRSGKGVCDIFASHSALGC